MATATPRRFSNQCETSATSGAKVAAALKPIRTWAAANNVSDEVVGASAKPSERPTALRIEVKTMPRRSTSLPATTPPAKKPSIFMV